MIKKSFLPILLFLSINVYGQLEYREGYFINNNDERISCLIYDQDWYNTPDQFSYKLSLDGAPMEGTLESVKEFGLPSLRYVRAKIKIDVSPTTVTRLDYNKYPVWEEKTIFLKVVEEGPATLYVYKGTGPEKFFFSVEGESIEQLVHKRYLYDPNKNLTKFGLYEITAFTTNENRTYLNQLQLKMNCNGKADKKSFYKMPYKFDRLKKYFIRHNACIGFEKPANAEDRGRTTLTIKLTPGLSFVSLDIQDRISTGILKSGDKVITRTGLEMEVGLPFNKNKWSVFFEPTYQKFSDDGVRINYTSVEIPIGLRHYFFVGRASRIFLNAAVVPDFAFGNKIINKRLQLDSTPSVAFGAGYKFGNISIETRYYTNRDIINLHLDFVSAYKKTSVIVGYSIPLSKRKK